MTAEPAYLALHRAGELRRRAERLARHFERCALCPRGCGVERRGVHGAGVCRTGALASVAAAFPHFGEESVLRGTQGSGTVFFTGCNLGCVFCQNWDISHERRGDALAPTALAQVMLALQAKGCHNLNVVTPSHVVPQLLAALDAAAAQGFRLPLVWNTGGYDSVDTLRELDGVVDIYMPDVKTLDSHYAQRDFGAPDYPDVVAAALAEMRRQVGPLLVDEAGLACRGLLVRHLVMPARTGDAAAVMRFVSEVAGPGTFVNVMDQYAPAGRAGRFADLRRSPTAHELAAAHEAAERCGLMRVP